MSGVKVLVVDAGGRGNAIADSFAKSHRVKRVYVAPGNAGTTFLKKCSMALAGERQLKSIREMLSFAEENEIDLTFVGPEGYLSEGIVNAFLEEGLQIVGPRREATILEGSKCDTKDFLKSINVPVPLHQNFRDPEKARDYVDQFYDEFPGKNLVIKADGLAAGKGSIVCNSRSEAKSAVDRIMVGPKLFGDAGSRVDIEERLYGEELMFFAVTDGDTIYPLESAMDYKRAFSPDENVAIRLFNRLSGNPNLNNNPNTGGMGGYSPHPWLDDILTDKIMQKIAVPTITRFRELTGVEYQGMIYFGLMICEEDGSKEPYVLEINVRLGDPEAEIILPRLNTDMYTLSEAILNRELDSVELQWSPLHHLGICAISGRVVKPYTSGPVEERPGYPGDHYTNMPISGLDRIDPDVLIYHNGTALGKDLQGRRVLYTTGGRVLTLVGRGNTLEDARRMAYENIKRIRFNGMRYRRDIGLTR